MKRFLIVFLFTLCVSPLFAGSAGLQKTHDSLVQLGTGVMIGSGLEDGSVSFAFLGPSLHLSYGHDFFINDEWSVMPGVGVKSSLSSPLEGTIFCQGKYLMPFKQISIAFGLGPGISYRVFNDRYGDIEDTGDPEFGYLYNKQIFNRLSAGIIPSLSIFCTRHLILGLEAEIGLTRLVKNHGSQSGMDTSNVRGHHLRLTCGYCF